MLYGVDGIEDFLERAEGIVGKAGRVRRAYLQAKQADQQPQPQPVSESRQLKTVMNTYLIAGGAALIAWVLLSRK